MTLHPANFSAKAKNLLKKMCILPSNMKKKNELTRRKWIVSEAKDLASGNSGASGVLIC